MKKSHKLNCDKCDEEVSCSKKLKKVNEGYLCIKCRRALSPLRIKITNIRKERLLGITEADAKKEGFSTKGIETARDNFLKAFIIINWKEIPRTMKFKEAMTGYKTIVDLGLWNPEVWVINFEVKK